MFTLLRPFLISSPIPLVKIPRQDLFTFLSSVSDKRNFCLFKIAIQEFHCDVSMCNYNQMVHPLYFFPFYLSLPLMESNLDAYLNAVVTPTLAETPKVFRA
jgi:hypothetical protein